MITTRSAYFLIQEVLAAFYLSLAKHFHSVWCFIYKYIKVMSVKDESTSMFIYGRYKNSTWPAGHVL